MPVIDADAHVAENDRTFEYLATTEQDYKPVLLRKEDDTYASNLPPAYGVVSHLWLMGGRTYYKQNVQLIEETSNGVLPEGSLDLRRPAARISEMDSQGVDIAAIFPNLFLITSFNDPAQEMALARSYNRWLAECCSHNPERLRWVALVGPRMPEASVAELRWAKQNGACGVLLRGFEGDMTPLQVEFEPIFKAALDLDLPICMHIGHGSRSYLAIRITTDQRTDPFSLYVPTLLTFSALMRADLHERFPGLRFGIIEAGSSWLPFLGPRALWSLGKRDAAARVQAELKERNIFITCEEHEDIPNILRYSGEDNLVLGSDYGHPGDISESIFTHRNFAARTDVSEAVKKRIMTTNGQRLFGF